MEVDKLDTFIDNLPPIQDGNLVYVDEIGQMQLFSDKFKRLVTNYLGSLNHYAGTITSVFQDDFTKQILQRNDIVLLEVTPENRDQIIDILNSLAINLEFLDKFNSSVQHEITSMARDYARSEKLTQLKKLFKNAIKYLAAGKIEQIDAQTFRIQGDHDDHIVKRSEQWICDCDLFLGVGKYKSNADECSHIQAIKLYRLM